MAGEGEEGDERVRRSVEGGRHSDLEVVAAAAAWRWRRRKGDWRRSAVTVTAAVSRLRVAAAVVVMKTFSRLGQGVAAIVVAAARMCAGAAASTTVRLLPRPSMSSHSRGRRLLFFSQMTARVCGGGGPFPSYRAQDGPRGERAHLRPMTLNLKKS